MAQWVTWINQIDLEGSTLSFYTFGSNSQKPDFCKLLWVIVSQTLADNDAFVVVVTVSIVEGTDDGIDTSAIDWTHGACNNVTQTSAMG